MFDLLTPENLPATLTAFAGLITAIGGGVLWKVRKEPAKAGTSDAALAALAENTRATLAMAEAMKAQNDHFGANNQMFRAMGPMVSGLARDIADIRHDTADSKSHLSGIKDALNRRG